MNRKWLLIMLVLLSAAQACGLSFHRVAFFPSGMFASGYIKGMDADNDGYEDLIFATHLNGQVSGTAFWGYRPFNRYVFEDSIYGPRFWDIGNLDGDSFLDMVVQEWDTLIGKNAFRVYEQTNQFVFPKNPVWIWRCEVYGFQPQPSYITDLDRDGQKEILTADATVLYVFECRGDNYYQKVWWDTVKINSSVAGVFAFGDFDQDSLTEFVKPAYSNRPDVLVYECVGDDQYQMVFADTLNTPNLNDAITGPDLDGDGKLEFIFGSLRTGSPYPWKGCLWIHESTGNNQYELIYSDSVAIPSDRGGYVSRSDCGDVDRDGRPELVWATDRDWMVYKSPGNNQFQRVFSAYGDNGRYTTHIHIHDMNGNGYPEIIESGCRDIGGRSFGETNIWEVEACQVVFPNGGETLYGDSLAVIRWRNVDPFRADSFSLFYSSDSGLTYSPVAHGVPGSDSAFTWTVPRTYSDDCFVMLWAYQNATGWDFSDSHFRIRNGNGVEQGQVVRSSVSQVPYRVAPNPFVSFATLPGHEKESFALYDVSGRKVGVFKGDRIGSGLSAGIYFLKPEGADAKSLRIVKLR